MDFEFLSILAHSKNLTKEELIKATRIRDAIKGGNLHVIDALCTFIKDNSLLPYFENSCLIPAPKSSKDITGGLKPSKEICNIFVNNGIGTSTFDIISRHTAIRKASYCSNADERPSVDEHIETMSVKSILIEEPTLILIDDVLSLGRMSYACCKLLSDAYPDKNIKIFCPVKTSNYDIVTSMATINKGYIHFNKSSRKTSFKK